MHCTALLVAKRSFAIVLLSFVVIYFTLRTSSPKLSAGPGPQPKPKPSAPLYCSAIFCNLRYALLCCEKVWCAIIRILSPAI